MEKSQNGIFEKILDMEIFAQKSPKNPLKSDTLMFFPKSGSNDFFGFWPEFSTKYDLEFE